MLNSKAVRWARSKAGVTYHHTVLARHPRILSNSFPKSGNLDRLAAPNPTRFRVLTFDRNVGEAEAVRRGLLGAFDDGSDHVDFLGAAAGLDPAQILVEHPLTEWRHAPGSKLRFRHRLRALFDLGRIRPRYR